MTIKIEKRAKAKQRQKEVAEAFETWLKNNPNAPKRKKIKMLDSYSDSAYLRDMLDAGN